MKKSLLSVALCVMTLLIGISPASAQGQNKEYQETLHKMLLLSGGLATVDTMVPQIIGMMKQQSPSVSEATWNAVMEKAKQFFSDNLVKVYVPIYQKHLTLGDLKKIVAFYEETPDIGRPEEDCSLLRISGGQEAGSGYSCHYNGRDDGRPTAWHGTCDTDSTGIGCAR